MKKVISNKEIKELEKHVLTDIGFKSGGTFVKDNNTPDWDFDEKSAKRVKQTLAKIKFLVKLLNKQ